MRTYAVLLLLFLVSLSAQARDGESHWFEVRSDHFTVLTDSNEREGRRIATQFERMRSVFHTLFPTATYDKGTSIVVLALRDRKSFQTLEPTAYLAKGQVDLAGFFQRTPNKNYILLRLDAGGEHPFATVYHEYTHSMTTKSEEWIPLWLNEGFAEFYQNTDIGEKEVLLGQPSTYDILYLRANRLLPLTTLLRVDHASPYYHDEQKGSMFYSESWALTHYILMTDNETNQHRMQDYSQYLIQHEDPVTAAEHAFGDLNKLQKALDNYVSQQSFQMFKMKTGVTIDESTFKVRPVPTAEANVIRADVLLNNGRIPEAQGLLESVLREDPKNAMAYETMGSLKFRERDIPAARRWFGEAVELDSQSYLAHYYFAVMSLQGGDRSNDAPLEASLRTAIQLNPSFAPAYDTLAMLLASRNDRLPEAHILTLHAVELEPGNLQYRLNGATVLSQQKQYVAAISVLQVAKKVAKVPGEMVSIQNTIERLQSYEGGQQVDGVQTVTLHKDGTKVLVNRATAEEETHYPEEATGPKRKVKGVLRGVKCSYPTVLTLNVEQAGKTITLYSNNYFKIPFTLGNYDSNDEILPCKAIDGMKANVEYSEVTDPKVAGQIVAIELNK